MNTALQPTRLSPSLALTQRLRRIALDWRVLLAIALIVAFTAAYGWLRAREQSVLAGWLTQVNFTFAQSLRNSAIFSNESADDVSKLTQATLLLEQMQQNIAKEKFILNKSAQKAAIDYVAYLNRIAQKFTQVAASASTAQQAMNDYDSALRGLSSALTTDRSAVVQALEKNRTDARTSTELAYQECVLMRRLIEQYPVLYRHSASQLSSSLLIEPATLQAFDTPLKKEMERRHENRRRFNPAAQWRLD